MWFLPHQFVRILQLNMQWWRSKQLLEFIYRVGTAYLGFGMVGEEERENDTRFTMVQPIMSTSTQSFLTHHSPSFSIEWGGPLYRLYGKQGGRYTNNWAFGPYYNQTSHIQCLQHYSGKKQSSLHQTPYLKSCT